jgi:hypothetical protein
MAWHTQLDREAVSWLVEAESPGVRYLALRDLLDCPPEDTEYKTARTLAHRQGQISQILYTMQPAGYWAEPGPGYLPKYTSTVWAAILLAQLGARVEEDPRIGLACTYLLDNALAPGGQFSASGPASGTADCLQGNLCWALTGLGCEDPRLEQAYDWMARTVTGDGIAPLGDRQASVRYYAGKCGPLFSCGSNNKLPCAWGAAKVMLAFGNWPKERWTPQIVNAVQAGLDFLLDPDPSSAAYPNGWAEKPSGNWWKFGFPVFYVADILQIAEAVAGLGYGDDPRLANALRLIRQKQDASGRWLLEYDYSGKTLADFGPKKQPNKWVTLRALRVLKKCGAVEGI